ncbi:isoprenylcysteine carboxylmethyltransferase family protein [Sulfurimonas paralvinellae]|uniref:Isoprenylcysteine carboxylmethyltransferase family protein n=2 Tax=Sulfurimonas paralvinellae TaxID=317658 RepID=A0A7M1B512_9BACT|nr:isoprenylcysteine carboxylmethyltransferase family protein [Sulfurimonas paralvinellae]
MKSKILVFLQFFIIFLMLLPFGSHTLYLYPGLFITAVGMIVGFLAIGAHKRGNFNIRPDIKESCELVTHSIYAYVRHPMYLSVLLMMLGITVIYFSYYELVLYLLLVITLLVKLTYEEHLWQCHSEVYEAYKKRTKRLIPFLF